MMLSRYVRLSLWMTVVLMLAGLPAGAVVGTGSAVVTSSTPGASYVGELAGGASGVYLGNDYVLIAAHEGASDFTLDNVTYSMVAGSAVDIGTSDLILFRISGGPSLTPLTLPTATSTPTPGRTSFDLIGFGGGEGETYGVDTVTSIDDPTSLSGFTSEDFEEASGTYNFGSGTFTNSVVLTDGDSGGGDFTDLNGNLVLIGINEAVLKDETTGDVVGSAFIQLSDYSALIKADMAPEPPAFWLVAAGMALLGLWPRARRALARVTGH